MKYKEETLRAYTTEEIYELLKNNLDDFTLSNQVVLCDELLLRKQPIKYVSTRYEFLIRKLRNQKLAAIDAYDFNYAKATVNVAIHEIIKRGLKPLEWLYISKYEGQKGPVDRLAINELVQKGEISKNTLLWRIGMDEWKKLDEMPHLTEEAFYDQIFNDELAIYQPKQEKHTAIDNEYQDNTKSMTSKSFSIIPGIMELMSFPMWIILAIVLFVTGFSSPVGVILPFIFSIFILLSIIPVGIGLIARQKWAWSIKVTTAIMAIVLLFAKLLVDDAGIFLQFVLIYEMVLVGLLFYRKESYEFKP